MIIPPKVEGGGVKEKNTQVLLMQYRACIPNFTMICQHLQKSFLVGEEVLMSGAELKSFHGVVPGNAHSEFQNNPSIIEK